MTSDTTIVRVILLAVIAGTAITAVVSPTPLNAQVNLAPAQLVDRSKHKQQLDTFRKNCELGESLSALEEFSANDMKRLQQAKQNSADDQKTLRELNEIVASSQQLLADCYENREDFERAKTALQQVLAAQIEINGLTHYEVADTRRALGYVDLLVKLSAAKREQLRQVEALTAKTATLYGEGKVPEAITLARQVVATYKNVLGEKHSYTASSLNELGFLLNQHGDFSESRLCLEQALAIRKEVLGDKHPDTASTLGQLGLLLQSQRDYADAQSYLEQALAITKEVHGEKHSDTAMALNNLGLLFKSQRDYAKARPYYEQALAIQKAILGEKHEDTANTLNNLAVLFLEQGDYASASRYLEQALRIKVEVLGEKHPDTTSALSNLAHVLVHQSDYAGAKVYWERALANRRELLGEKHPDTADSMSNLGALLQTQGDFPAAQAYIEQALAINEGAFGEKNRSTAASLQNLGMFFLARGDSAKARPYVERALAVFKDLQGPQHPDTVLVLNNLGLILHRQGDYAGARQYYEQALAVYKQAVGEKHALTGRALSNLGGVHYSQGDFPGARTYYEQALAIRKEALGPQHSDTANSLVNLGGVLAEQRDYGLAGMYLEQALAIYKSSLGEKHPLTATTLNNLGSLQETQGAYLLAQRYFDQALTIRKEVLGDTHPDTITSLHSLGVSFAADQQWEKAGELFDQSRRAVRRHVAIILPGLSEQEQIQFLRTQDADSFQAALSLGVRKPEQQVLVDLSAAWILNGKAVAQQALAERIAMSRDSRDPELASLLQQLQSLRQQLAQLTVRGPDKKPEEYRERLASLETQERKLSRQVGLAQRQVVREEPWVELDEVRLSLPPGSMLIEIARLNVYNFQANLQEPNVLPSHYVAWLIPPAGQGMVQLIDLGSTQPIDGALVACQKMIQAAGKQISQKGEVEAEADLRVALKTLSAKLLGPLLTRLDKTPRWLISADAALWLVPWAALPLDNGDYAIEKHQISYLISGRTLATGDSNPRPLESSLVLADPSFDLLPESPQSANKPNTLGDSTMARGLVSSDWSPLPGTAKEAHALVPYLETFLKSHPDVYLGDRAVESVVKNAQRPRVLVLSTHGYFLEDQNSEPVELSRGVRRVTDPIQAQNKPSFQQRPREIALLENPLLRCGLVLAGANQREHLPAGADDGILTGLEIVGADLRGTELVVLSACETGLGTINNGEGVAGLRQAFQLAGAETVVSTLWKIPDEETAQLMTAFWRQLAMGRNKADALRNAQLSLIRDRREQHKAANPFFWAAFTLTGQTRFPEPQ